MFHFVVAHLVGQYGQSLSGRHLVDERVEQDDALRFTDAGKISVGVGRAPGAVHRVNAAGLEADPLRQS